MLARLGDVIYWAGCLLAAPLVALISYSITITASFQLSHLYFLSIAFGIWLIGLAFRYVLAGRGWSLTVAGGRNGKATCIGTRGAHLLGMCRERIGWILFGGVLLIAWVTGPAGIIFASACTVVWWYAKWRNWRANGCKGHFYDTRV